MDVAQIRVLQQRFNDAISKHEEEDGQRVRSHSRGDCIGEKRHLDRMKQFGTLAVDIQRKIGELMNAAPTVKQPIS
jgi:hypothetical protein